MKIIPRQLKTTNPYGENTVPRTLKTTEQNNSSIINNNICPSKDEQDSSLQELANNFDKIWNLYPRKEGKNTAFIHYKSWLKGKKYAGKTVKLTNRQMWFAVKKYADLIERKRVEKQYIKMGSTFFNEAIMEFIGEETV